VAKSQRHWAETHKPQALRRSLRRLQLAGKARGYEGEPLTDASLTITTFVRRGSHLKPPAEPRSAAYDILESISRGHSMERALEGALDALSPRDRRLAHEIAAGTLRHRRILDLTINQALTQPVKHLPPKVRNVLRIGTYQIHYLDRVPAYAAVTASVDLARLVGGERAAKLTNAVLRRVSRSPRYDVTQCTMAERYSHPDWLIGRWKKRFGRERTEQLLVHNNAKPSIIVQPVLRAQEEIRESFIEANVPFDLHPTGMGLRIRDSEVQQLPGYHEGAFIVQDPAQRMLLEYAAIPSGSMVWDVCAAPGGKAVTLAVRHRVMASDGSSERMERLRENAERAASELWLVGADATKPPVRPRTFDAVLVDAPCSATGTMARHPDARWSLSPKKIRNAVALQAVILASVADAVKPGGLLVYLTCSLEKEENEEQVDRFLEAHVEFERTGDDRAIFPADYGTDGGFGARMRRVK